MSGNLNCEVERTAFALGVGTLPSMRALIVGAGTMGRWFADLTSDWFSLAVVDVDEEAAQDVGTALDIDVVAPDHTEAIDVLCTAVPLPATEAVLGTYAPHAEQAIIDLSGTMHGPLAAMQEHAPNCEHISLHPLFAPDNAPGNVPIVAEHAGPVAAKLRRTLDEAGYVTFDTTPDEHDRAMETVQAKVHAAVLAYALSANPVDDRFHTPVSSAMDDLVQTMLSGNPRVYADIQNRFAGSADLAASVSRVADSDTDDFYELFAEAREQYQWPPHDDE